MTKVGIFYGSSRGNTENVAKNIFNALGSDNADIYNIRDVRKEDLEKYDYIILGTSTWGNGDLQKDWDGRLHIIDEVDWTGKKVALCPHRSSRGKACVYASSKPSSNVNSNRAWFC